MSPISLIIPIIFIAIANWIVSFFLFKVQPPFQKALRTTAVSTFLVSIPLTINVEASMPADFAGTFIGSFLVVLIRLIIPALVCLALYYFMLRRRWIDEPVEDVFE